MTSACRYLEIRCKSSIKKEATQKSGNFGNVSEMFRKFFGKSRKIFGNLPVRTEGTFGIG